MSSSSGSTGESMTKHSSPSRTIVHAVWKTRDVATRTPGWSPTTRKRLGLQELRRLEEALHLGGRLLLARLQGLLVAVDPDHRHLRLDARLDVVVVARCDVHPALLGADPPRALVEVRGIGLVGAHLLGGDDEVEVVRDVAARLAEQLVVDVRDQARLKSADELAQLRIGLLERRPTLNRVRQEPGAARLQRPADALGDLDRRAAQDLGVQLVGAALDLARDLVEERDDLFQVDREAVALRLALERVPDALFPIDEGAVDVEGDPVDLARERHWIGHCAIRLHVDAVRLVRLRDFEVAAQLLVVIGEVPRHSDAHDRAEEAGRAAQIAFHDAPDPGASVAIGLERPRAVDGLRAPDHVHLQPLRSLERGELDDLLELLHPRRLRALAHACTQAWRTLRQQLDRGLVRLPGGQL